MTARRTDPLPGIAAQYPSECPRCSGGISVGDRIAFSRGRAIHVACASGQDDDRG